MWTGTEDLSPTRIFVCSLYFVCTTSFFLIVLAVPFALAVQHTTQTIMPPEGFEPAIPASDWLPTLALDHSAAGIGNSMPGPSSPQRVVVPTELSRLTPMELRTT